MQEVSPKICLAAVMIRCTTSDQTCKCTIAKYSESTSSYHGKILGAIITQLILGAAVTGQMGPYPIMTEDCDNNGVVMHGNRHYWPLSASQTRSNVLQVMKQLITHQPFIIKFSYVQSHSDDIKEWSACTIKECMNIKVDHLTKMALLHAHTTNEFFNGLFLLDDLSFLWMDKRSLDLS
jgi:hypothetical protein